MHKISRAPDPAANSYPPHLILRPRSGWSPSNFGMNVISPETRMMGLPYSEEIMIVSRTMWTQCTSVTDGRTDWRTDRITITKTVQRIASHGKNDGRPPTGTKIFFPVRLSHPSQFKTATSCSVFLRGGAKTFVHMLRGLNWAKILNLKNNLKYIRWRVHGDLLLIVTIITI